VVADVRRTRAGNGGAVDNAARTRGTSWISKMPPKTVESVLVTRHCCIDPLTPYADPVVGSKTTAAARFTRQRKPLSNFETQILLACAHPALPLRAAAAREG